MLSIDWRLMVAGAWAPAFERQAGGGGGDRGTSSSLLGLGAVEC